MKTNNIFIIILLTFLFFSCETIQEKQEFQNKGPTLESRLYGTWNSISVTPHGVAPEYENKPYDCFDYKVIINENMIYEEYYKGKLSTKQTFYFNDTIYNKQNNTYSGNIILEDSLTFRFTVIQDNLFLTATNKGNDLVVGNSSIHYKKEF